MDRPGLRSAVARSAESVTVGLVAGLRRRPVRETEAWVAGLPPARRRGLVAGTVAALFAAALGAAWAGGPIGLGLYFAVVALLVR
jgi:hypothetical protein